MKALSISIMLFAVTVLSACGGGGGGGGTVGDTTAPTVAITAPANGATVSGIITLTANASDNSGSITKVEYYLNGALLSTSNSSPYTFSWNTATKSDGSYTLYAKAYDAANNVGQSTNVVVTISNPNQKTATLVISSQSANPTDEFGGFEINVTLPAGASLKTDSNNVPLASVVYLSGQLAGSTLSSQGVIYDAVLRTLTVSFPSINSYPLGEFLQVVCDVPIAYTPNVADVTFTDTLFFAPLTGATIPSISTSAIFI